MDQVMAAVSRVMGIIATIIGWLLILLIGVKIAQLCGARLPLLPAIDHITLVYTAGAWYLARK